jgi:hypothetical protein
MENITSYNFSSSTSVDIIVFDVAVGVIVAVSVDVAVGSLVSGTVDEGTIVADGSRVV